MPATKAPKKSARKKPTKKAKKAQPPLIRTSERSLFKSCHWAWDRAYNDRLQPIQEKPALRFGTLVHAALEVRYPKGKKRGPKPAITFEKLYDKELAAIEKEWGPEMIRDSDGEWAEMKDLGIHMLENYVKVYGKDEEWEVIESEMTFKVPVYAPEHPDGFGGYMNLKGERIPKRVILFYYVGTMDGVWKNRMDSGIRINDYKTTANDPSKEGLSKSVLDEQGTAYWTWGVDFLIEKGILKPREEQALDGMLYTFLRKAYEDDRPKDPATGARLNKDGTISKKQPLPLFHRDIVYRSESSREKARERAVLEAVEMWQRRNGILPIYKTPETGSMGHCGWCSYRDPCELHEEGADYESMLKAGFKPWDPYSSHEIREENKRR